VLKKLQEAIKKQVKEKFKFCNLYIKNLPDDYDDEQLFVLFAKYGKIRSAKTLRKELFSTYLGIKKTVKVCAFVCFQDAKCAKDAKDDLNLSNIFPNLGRLFVDYHQCKKDRAEILKLKQIHHINKEQVAKSGQELLNQNMVIKQMQLGGSKYKFLTII